jgi:hypothetical protein
VHTDSKIQCEMCNSEFSTKSSMQRHMKEQHWPFKLFLTFNVWFTLANIFSFC